MARALAAETEARDRRRNAPEHPGAARMRGIVALFDRALEEKKVLLRCFEDIRAIPTNLHIVASRLEILRRPGLDHRRELSPDVR